ncbi:MAG: UbiX family flavin prenyltransferase [Gammaproteobacteria bacterium]|jgi:4-hydroxy-3-polyprenylbenzoate decarboxylase|nr:UbiX family flavin prenyltransferase [Gammaproteobacteria bacterium]
MTRKSITLAITGASGVQYGLRLLQCLVQADYHVCVLISPAAQVVIATETDITVSHRPGEAQPQLCELCQCASDQITVYGKENWMAPIASGSNTAEAMVVCPCSSATLSAIAHGTSGDLIERAADVMLKEQRKLILVNREMPLSAIHLDNMSKLAHLGVTIMPACPGFYHKPQTVQELVDFVVARVLDHLHVPHQLVPRWGQAAD